MKIALTGASSTGKTTLAKALVGSEFEKTCVKEYLSFDTRRILTNMGFHAIDDMSNDEYIEFQQQVIQAKIKNEHNKNNYITDRSFADYAAYIITRVGVNKKSPPIEKLLRKCKKLSMTYDITFFLPIGRVEFVPDGYRVERADYHKRVEEEILKRLKIWNILYYRIEKYDVRESINEVQEHIKDYLK